MRSVTLLGSTGSIGESSIKVIELHRDQFRIEAITAYNNVEKLAAQAIKLGCKRAVIGNNAHYGTLKSALAGTGIEAASGIDAIIEAAIMPSDIVIAAIVGAAGLLPALAAIHRGATIALANKECLVCAGDIFTDAVKQHNATLIPVDSEHSAIFQVLDAHRPDTIEKIFITASGGPFREFSNQQMQNVTVEQALKHPTWNMGAKISIDSATMMNKGLEIIEARRLFPVSNTQIEVLVHPESIIHSMVSYIDGSVLAQLGAPDMCTPIAYALAWPNRIACPSKRLDLAEIGKLTFYAPDPERFPALRLSKAALDTGGNAPAILNAANEVAVERFLKKEIAFPDIISIIEATLAHIPFSSPQTIEEVIEVDNFARTIASHYKI